MDEVKSIFERLESMTDKEILESVSPEVRHIIKRWLEEDKEVQ